MFFLKSEVLLGMYMFYIVVIKKQNYCFLKKELNCIKEVQKTQGIPSIKIPLNVARRNHYLDSR